MANKDNAWGFMATSYDATIDREAAKNCDVLLTRMGGTEDTSRDLYIDPRFSDWIQLAYDVDKMALAFWNVAPRYWLKWSGPHAQYTQDLVSKLTDAQHPILQKILGALHNGAGWKNGVSLHGFMFDVEEYSFWTDGGPVTDSWITFYIKDIWERMQRMIDKKLMPPLRFGVYGRKLFIDEKCPSLNVFLGTRPEWDIFPAEWLSGPDGVAPLSEIKKIRPPDTVTVNGVVKPYVPRLFGYCPTRTKQWSHWQYLGDAAGSAQTMKSNDVLTALGQPRPICAQMYNGTAAQMYKDYNFVPKGSQPGPVDPPPPTEVIDAKARADILALTARLTTLEVTNAALAARVADLEAWRAKVRAA